MAKKERRNVFVSLSGLKILKALDADKTAEVYLKIENIRWPMEGYWKLKANDSLKLGSGKSGRVIWEGMAFKDEKLTINIAVKEADTFSRDDTFCAHEEIYVVGTHSSDTKHVVEIHNDKISVRFKFWDISTKL
ncbi:MAG: hypothetical protein ACFFBD_06665 [Candidatus Hodarchaeota archaeon]